MSTQCRGEIVSLGRHRGGKSAYSWIPSKRQIGLLYCLLRFICYTAHGLFTLCLSSFCAYPYNLTTCRDPGAYQEKSTYPATWSGQGPPCFPPHLRSLFHYGLGTVLCCVFSSMEARSALFLHLRQELNSPFPTVFYLSSTAPMVLDIWMKTCLGHIRVRSAAFQ